MSTRHKFPCSNCARKFASIHSVNAHKRFCKPVSTRATGVSNTNVFDDSFIASQFPNSSLLNYLQPDDYEKIFAIGGAGENDYSGDNGSDYGEQWWEQKSDAGARIDEEDPLLRDAKKWKTDMDALLSRPCNVVYGRGTPTSYWLNKQKAIYIIMDKTAAACRDPEKRSSGPLKLGWVKDPLSGIIAANNWQTVMDLYSLIRNCQLSTAQGDLILETFRRIHARNNATIVIPTTVSSVIVAVEKTFSDGGHDNDKGVIEVTFGLSNLFFKGHHIDFGTVSAVGVLVNCFQLITELFCESRIEDFDTRPVELMLVDPESDDTTPRRYIAGHATANDFKKFCAAGVRDYGDSFMPVSCQLQQDATVYEGGGKKTMTPMYLRVMNLIEDLYHEHSLSVKLCGLMPTILATNEELKRVLTNNGFVTKTDQNDILRYINRYLHGEFMKVAIEHLQKDSINGAYLTFGKSSRTKKYIAVPLVMNLPNDNQERYTLLGLKHSRHGIRNCCQCNLKTKYFYRLGTPGRKQLTIVQEQKLRRKIDRAPLRDATVHRYLGEVSESTWMQLLSAKSHTVMTGGLPVPIELRVTPAAKAFIGRDGPVYAYNVQFQSCLLYNVMDYQIRNEIVTPITISWFEVLHSVHKGIVEFVFRQVMACVHLSVKNNVHGVNTDAIGIIDTRVKNFMVSQPYALFGSKSVIVHKGFSPCFKDTKTTANALSKGTLTGGNIDANRLVYYLFYEMMSIGCESECLPNRSIRLQLPPDGEWVTLNPFKVAINACTAAIELCTIYKGDLFSEHFDLPKLRYCTHVANARAKTLYLMKQGLGGLQYGKVSSELFNIKMHGSSHNDQGILGTGEPRAWDSSPFESEHSDVKDLAALTSRRSGTVHHEILLRSRNIDSANFIERARFSNSVVSDFDGNVSDSGGVDHSISEYFEDKDFSGSLTNTDGDRPSKCTIKITDSRLLSWTIDRKLPRRKSVPSSATTISAKLQSVLFNAVEHGLIRDAIQGQSSSSSSSRANINTFGRKPTSSPASLQYIPFLFPYIKIPYLLESLQNYGDSIPFVKEFLRLLKSGHSSVSLELLSHFSVIPCGVKNSSPDVDAIRSGGCMDSEIFRFYTSNEYRFKRGHSYLLDKLSRRYDCAMFKYVDSNDDIVVQPARVFGILKLVDHNLSDKVNSTSTNKNKRGYSTPSTNGESLGKAKSTRTMFEKLHGSKYTRVDSGCKNISFITPKILHRREPKDSISSLSAYKDEDDKILLLICWLVPASKGILRSCFPYPYYKYDTYRHGNSRVLYTQIVNPSSLYLPLYTIHDVNTRPSYETEGSSLECLENDRFWSFPFEIFRKMRRQYFGCFPNTFLYSDNDEANRHDNAVIENEEVIESIHVAKVVSKKGNESRNPIEGNVSDSGDDEEDFISDEEES